MMTPVGLSQATEYTSPAPQYSGAVAAYLDQSLADNTRRAYEADLAHFREWGGAIPCSGEAVAEYLAAHAHHLSMATLDRRVIAISRAHALRGFPSPTQTGLVRATRRGIRRVHGEAQKQAAALSMADLGKVLAGFGSDPKGVRDRALLLLGFAGAFRRSELVSLDRDDLETAPKGLVVYLRHSKTDQVYAGRRLGIPYGVSDLCPVLAVADWVSRLPTRYGPLFRRVDRHGNILDQRLSAEAVSLIVKERVGAAGFDPDKFSGHSLRAGFATAAAQAGVASWRIRQQTGHASDAMLGLGRSGLMKRCALNWNFGPPNALAPERLLVFEVRGSISNFATAVRKVPGLELIDEEELSSDEKDEAPVAYLMVPDMAALRNLESLWRRWTTGKLQRGETPWRDVFALLRDLRPWGPQDRVHLTDAAILTEEVFGRAETDLLRLEIELVFRAAEGIAATKDEEVRAAIVAAGGSIVSASRIPEIAYHALLAELPVSLVRQIIDRSPAGIAGLETVMHIRPQSTATSLELGDEGAVDAVADAGALGEPVLGLIDGVPVSAHALLSQHVSVDDQFGLEPVTPVADRFHGTAMASLIIHGDRNRLEPALPRRIHVVPVLGPRDAFPTDRLIVDIIYSAVSAMKEGAQPTAPGVVIINLSLGNRCRPFQGQLSPWARLLDRLSYKHGILFLVSAGNNTDRFPIAAFQNGAAFQASTSDLRATATVRAIGNLVADRRLLSPAETVNGVTIGACNSDFVSPADRVQAAANIDPYPALLMSNPSSTLGPGFALSVKPDVLMPGAREHLRVVRTHAHIEVQPTGPGKASGLKVAAPPRMGQENRDGYTCGTSAATALASRTCHRIHDALEAAYGAAFLDLPHIQRAVILKALLAHTAKWPLDAASLIRTTIGPPEAKYASRQKDNIRRFLGYGIVDAGDATACAADRATFWATGTLAREKIASILVPIPAAMGGKARAHSMSATLSWFTPVTPGRKSYRSVRLKLLEPKELGALSLKSHGNQPDTNQSNRGTMFQRSWTGTQALAVSANMTTELVVQRDPDQGRTIDEPMSFGLAITLTMPGVVEIYDQVRARLAIMQRAKP